MNEEQLTQMQAQLDRIERASTIAAKSVLNIDEVVFMTGFSEHHIYMLTSRKQIPFSKKGGRLFFDKAKVNEWLLENSTESESEIEFKAKEYLTRNEAKAGRRKAAATK